MDSNTWLAVIIVFGIVVFLLRGRIKRLAAKLSIFKGEGSLDIEAAEPRSIQPPPDPHSINISGNVGLGKTKISVRRNDVAITDNKLVGDSEINVDQSGVKKSGK